MCGWVGVGGCVRVCWAFDKMQHCIENTTLHLKFA